VSREALSLEISHLVSRVVKGEPIDIPGTGAALAAKYPDTGMSGMLIGQAIERAAGMVGMIRSAPPPVRQKPSLRVVESSSPPAVANEPALPVETGAPAMPVESHGPAESVSAAAAETTVALHTPDLSSDTANNSALLSVANSIDEDLAAAIDAEIGNLVFGQTAKAPAPPTQAVMPSVAMPSWTLDDDAPVTEVAPEVASAANARTREKEQGSIFSTFRRVLFRT